MSQVGNLRSPELVEFFNLCRGTQSKKEDVKHATDFLCYGPLFELNESVLISRGTNIYEQIVEAAGLTRDRKIFTYFAILGTYRCP